MSEIALSRQSMAQTIRQSRNAHPGLLLRRGLTVLDTNSNQNGQHKAALISKVTDLPAPQIYLKALERWKNATADNERFSRMYSRFDQRLFIGLTAETALETGIQTHHTYGMPLIPGSSIKGCALAYASAIDVPAAYIAALFGEDETSAKQEARIPGAGCLIWHDAWWQPAADGKPFAAEIVTVHHQEYYAGTGEATDFDSPIPNNQLATCGTFYFVIEGDPAWTDLARNILQRALEEIGIGAKRAAAYGYAHPDQQMQQRDEAQQQQARRAQLPVADRYREEVAALSAEKLAEQLGRDRNNTRSKVETEISWEDYLQIVKEIHGATLEGWEKDSNKNRKKAWKTVFGQAGDNE